MDFLFIANYFLFGTFFKTVSSLNMKTYVLNKIHIFIVVASDSSLARFRHHFELACNRQKRRGMSGRLYLFAFLERLVDSVVFIFGRCRPTR